MTRRTIAVAAGVIAVLLTCSAAALAIHPLEPNEPGTPFATGEPAEYEVSGSVLVDGETYVDYEGVVAPDGPNYFRAESEVGHVRELYEVDGVVYAKLETTDTDRIDEHESTFGGEVVSREETDGRVTALLRAEDPERTVEESLGTWNELVVDNLQLTAYERADDAGVYEPQNGWFAANRDYRVTNADGELRVDPASGTVTKADVSYHRTFTGSSLEYLLHGGEAVRLEVSYELRPDSPGVEIPDWVERIRS